MLKNLINTEEMLVTEEKRDVYKEAMELHLKTDVSVDECAEIIQTFNK